MELVVASAGLKQGSVLSFGIFPTAPFSLSFAVTFHVGAQIYGKIGYRVRKRETVIYETEGTLSHVPVTQGETTFTHADSLEVVFPSQGSYLLDILFDGTLLHTIPFSVFDSSQRSDLEREIIYYLRTQRKSRSVQEIARGVYNPKILNKANMSEVMGRVYFALLRMQEVTNLDPVEQGSLGDKMNRSRWKLKE